MKLLSLFVGIIFLLFIAGCGGSGGDGTGDTVFLTAGITTGTSGSVFANISSVNSMSITLTSNAYTTTSTVPRSNVRIDSVTLNYTPLNYTGINSLGTTVVGISPTFTPQYANNPQGVGGLVPPGGTLKIDGIPFLGSVDLVNLAIAANTLNLEFVEFQYTASITFHCTEVNTGNGLSVTVPIGVAFSYP